MNCGLNLAPARGPGDVLDPVDHGQPTLGIEKASVAGTQPAIGSEHLGARRLIAEVASEQPTMAGVDLTHAALVRVDHAQLGVVERHARAVAVEIGVSLQSIGAGSLGLAVELPQRDAHGEKEAEGVGAERGATRRRRLQIGKPQPVAQGGEQQEVRQAAGALAPRPRCRHGRPTNSRRVGALRPTGARAHRPPSAPRPGAPAACGWGRSPADRASRSRDLREVHPNPAEQRHRHRVDLLHDPRQRQD